MHKSLYGNCFHLNYHFLLFFIWETPFPHAPSLLFGGRGRCFHLPNIFLQNRSRCVVKVQLRKTEKIYNISRTIEMSDSCSTPYLCLLWAEFLKQSAHKTQVGSMPQSRHPYVGSPFLNTRPHREGGLSSCLTIWERNCVSYVFHPKMLLVLVIWSHVQTKTWDTFPVQTSYVLSPSNEYSNLSL